MEVDVSERLLLVGAVAEAHSREPDAVGQPIWRRQGRAAPYGSGLSFRDPDNIALEFFAPPG